MYEADQMYEIYPREFYMFRNDPRMTKEARRKINKFIADKKNEEQGKPQKHKKAIKHPVPIQMPFIHSDPEVSGPLYVTEDWYVAETKKQVYERSRQIKEYQLDMMDLLARRDLLRHRLAKLDPGSPHDAEKIVEINVELKNIYIKLKFLQNMTGVNMHELDHGTKFARFINMAKKKISKKVKKLKKWVINHIEPICGIVASIIPIVGIVATMKLAKS